MPSRKYSFTINTDASFDQKTKIAGWACWIKSTHYKLQDSGLFPDPVDNSSVAELLAIEQALIRLDTLINDQEYLRHEMVNGILLYINTDSLFAIGAIMGRLRTPKYLELAKRVESMTDIYTIDARHVKAHTKAKNARSYVNEWCDRAAKRHVRQRMEQLNVRRTAKI